MTDMDIFHTFALILPPITDNCPVADGVEAMVMRRASSFKPLPSPSRMILSCPSNDLQLTSIAPKYIPDSPDILSRLNQGSQIGSQCLSCSSSGVILTASCCQMSRLTVHLTSSLTHWSYLPSQNTDVMNAQQLGLKP